MGPNSVCKQVLSRFISAKLKGAVHKYAIMSIISILIEEMLIDIRQFKEIDIFNFCSIKLKRTSQKEFSRYIDKVRAIGSNNKLYISINNDIKQFLLSRIDEEKIINKK